MVETLEDMIARHEGFRACAYRDSKGYLTIGFGRLIDNRISTGLTHEEGRYLLRNDIARVRAALSRYPMFLSLDEARQNALLDMSYNLGIAGLLNFKRMWAALERRDYDAAAAEILDSEFAKQVGDRAVELARMMREG